MKVVIMAGISMIDRQVMKVETFKGIGMKGLETGKSMRIREDPLITFKTTARKKKLLS